MWIDRGVDSPSVEKDEVERCTERENVLPAAVDDLGSCPGKSCARDFQPLRV